MSPTVLSAMVLNDNSKCLNIKELPPPTDGIKIRKI